MVTKKVAELQQQILFIESQMLFINGTIAVLLSEANRCDMEVMELTVHESKLKAQLKDLRAELADTI
jgi:hypothetical protein